MGYYILVRFLCKPENVGQHQCSRTLTSKIYIWLLTNIIGYSSGRIEWFTKVHQLFIICWMYFSSSVTEMCTRHEVSFFLFFWFGFRIFVGTQLKIFPMSCVTIEHLTTAIQTTHLSPAASVLRFLVVLPLQWTLPLLWILPVLLVLPVEPWWWALCSWWQQWALSLCCCEPCMAAVWTSDCTCLLFMYKPRFWNRNTTEVDSSPVT